MNQYVLIKIQVIYASVQMNIISEFKVVYKCQKPNRAGKDYFWFIIPPKGLMTVALRFKNLEGMGSWWVICTNI
jgi:hypothetical protein